MRRGLRGHILCMNDYLHQLEFLGWSSQSNKWKGEQRGKCDGKYSKRGERQTNVN